MRHSFLVALTALSITLAASANASSNAREVVNDHGSNIITNTFGNCVRTKWQSADDVCAPQKPAPAPVAAPVPAPAPAPVISQDARTIYFNFDEASLSATAIQKLDTLSQTVAASSGILSATVVGYADKIGNSDYNVILSQKRAGAVKQYLDSKLNIPTSVAAVQGLGSITSNTTCDATKKRTDKIECLANDRRVEVQFKYKQ
ncbi:MAG: OmpA family protein [Rickettsiales bacterium]|nr:OmpA family protein [Rickettsiales bacterium]